MQIWINQWVRILPKFIAHFQHIGFLPISQVSLNVNTFKVVLYVLKSIIHLNYAE